MKQKRRYRMQLRAGAVEETRESILQAAYELWLESPYDEVTLESVAERARVSKQTVIRQFGSKDRLAYAVVDWQRPREESARVVEPGNLGAAVSVLLDAYERMGDANVRMMELESRVAEIRYLLQQGRESHRAWIERIFAPFLPKRKGRAFERRVLAFYAATEVMIWKLLRRDFKRSREDTEAVIFELVSAIASNASTVK